MAFFSRLGNLARGAIAAASNPEHAPDDALLERELSAHRPPPRRAAAAAAPEAPPAPAEEPRAPLELNPDGSVKRTL